MLQMVLVSKIAGLVVRHGLTAAGGWMLSEGYADQAAVDAITGGGMALLGVALSFVEKRKFLG